MPFGVERKTQRMNKTGKRLVLDHADAKEGTVNIRKQGDLSLRVTGEKVTIANNNLFRAGDKVDIYRL
jgi:hypothetical protein